MRLDVLLADGAVTAARPLSTGGALDDATGRASVPRRVGDRDSPYGGAVVQTTPP